MYSFSSVRSGHSLLAAAVPGSYRPWGPSSGNSCLAAFCPTTWPSPGSTLPGAATQLSPCLPSVGKCALEQWPWLTGCDSSGPCSCYHSQNPLSVGDWEVNPRDASKCCSSGFDTPEVPALLDLKSRSWQNYPVRSFQHLRSSLGLSTRGLGVTWWIFHFYSPREPQLKSS